MEQDIQSSIIVIGILTALLIGLTFVTIIDSFIKKEHKKILLIIVAILASLIAQNFAEFILWHPGQSITLRKFVSIYGYIVRPIVIVMFLYLVAKKNRLLYVAWGLIGINALVYLTATFSKIAFYISKDNHFQRGPLGYTCHIVSAILLAYLFFLSIKECYNIRKLETIIPMFNACVVVMAIVLDAFVDYEMSIACLTIGMIVGTVFYYVWLHLRFVREHESALMAEQRIQIMMSQIQPHFLYNTLSTIQALCQTDPDKAFTVTENFGKYLRQNLNSLGQPNLIPMQKEIEHTRLYSEIEMVRFPNIHVEYDIKDEDFDVPALLVQPLVENAIRHGVRIREKGLVTVSTRKTPEYHIIVVKDNGKGFDINALPKMEETHVGLRNVQERVEKMCGGTMTIISRIDSGTTITIRLPLRVPQSMQNLSSKNSKGENKDADRLR